MKYLVLALQVAYALVTATGYARPLPDYADVTAVRLASVSDVQRELRGKSKAEVKAYFGRAPDVVENPDLWEYKGRFADEDSGKTFSTARISFWPDGTSAAGTVNWVRFY